MFDRSEDRVGRIHRFTRDRAVAPLDMFPFFDDLPLLVRMVLLISAVLVLVVGAGLVWRMVKAVLGRKNSG